MISILVGILLLYLGAESLVRGSSQLAAKFGIPPLIVGLTIVAFGTSAPELTVSLSAAFNGANGVSVGNVVGSNIFNIAVILGITALIRPPNVQINIIRREIPFLIFVTLIGSFLILHGSVSRLAGLTLFLGLCAYTVYCIREARKESSENSADPSPVKTYPTWLCGLLIILGLGVLVFGSHLFVEGAVSLARRFGVSEAIIGLTIVAAGTSLPELATSVLAALKKESDVAIGNIIGSCIFNILCILGLTASILPIEVTDIGRLDVALMLGLSIVLLPFAFSQRKISRLEGACFLAAYGIYLYCLWPTSVG
ncbi:calcium/sodium antiporter [Puniceicoccus vermicola]|uniref:Calcium/sodium antiporter n=1 Tax=Puniceicoccus vermicola TaxID=388746 RepID=A0A7X1E4P6_9BACT|nr:calcium/sodium antiporter [Puniceicoccus vermicola]MBC2602361.1 calcium/sodium antiporter [Puniceicoccus vermicola]